MWWGSVVYWLNMFTVKHMSGRKLTKNISAPTSWRCSVGFANPGPKTLPHSFLKLSSIGVVGVVERSSYEGPIWVEHRALGAPGVVGYFLELAMSDHRVSGSPSPSGALDRGWVVHLPLWYSIMVDMCVGLVVHLPLPRHMYVGWVVHLPLQLTYS